MNSVDPRPLIVHVVYRFGIGGLENGLVNLINRLPASLARHCVGEHGWDVNDLHGSNRRYARLRRMIRPLVHQHIALSRRTGEYLTDVVGVTPGQVSELCNGVDVARFSPPAAGPEDALLREAPGGWRLPDGMFVVGTVGRLASVKNQRLLCEAFLALRERSAAFRKHGRLLIVGDGPDRRMLQDLMGQADATHVVWFVGERGDIPGWLGLMDLFCLPSLAEGISNGILEAMACGLPVVATDVGGNAELVDNDITGSLLPDTGVAAMADAIESYFSRPARCANQGQAARARAVERFSLETMVAAYESLYSRLLADTGPGRISHRSPEKHSCAG